MTEERGAEEGLRGGSGRRGHLGTTVGRDEGRATDILYGGIHGLHEILLTVSGRGITAVVETQLNQQSRATRTSEDEVDGGRHGRERWKTETQWRMTVG